MQCTAAGLISKAVLEITARPLTHQSCECEKCRASASNRFLTHLASAIFTFKLQILISNTSFTLHYMSRTSLNENLQCTSAFFFLP